jgi:hypothetical protein
MPVPERPRHSAEIRFVAALYRRARSGDIWSLEDLALRAARRPPEPESELARAIRRAALDE